MGNVIYVESDDLLNIAILITRNGEVMVEDTPCNVSNDYSSPLDLNDAELFGFFDKLFGKQFDRVTLISNSCFYKSRQRIRDSKNKKCIFVDKGKDGIDTLIETMPYLTKIKE